MNIDNHLNRNYENFGNHNGNFDAAAEFNLDNGFSEIEKMTSLAKLTQSFNNPMMDMNKRPMKDFIHNNMVPFFKGSGTGQNMAGTGIASGSYIDGSNHPGNITGINTGFDNSTPWQTKLSTFTGTDDTYLHKREVGTMFSPAEGQTSWVFGTPLFRPDRDRYEQNVSKIRNDLKPIEPERVGPGLGIDPSIPATGGFHDFTRVMPNNVNDYKVNQLPGQVITGKLYTAALPTSYPGIGTEENPVAPGLTKNRPDTHWDQARYPTMSNRSGITQGNTDYNRAEYEVNLKPKNATRDQQNYGLSNEDTIGAGPLRSLISSTPQRQETYMSDAHNIKSVSDCKSIPVGNPERSRFGQGNISTWYANETDRGEISPQNLMQLNLSNERSGHTFYTYMDEPGTTMKETTQFSYSGNAVRSGDGSTFYTYVDEPETTMKETTQFSYSGNASRPSDGATFYTYVDEPETTMKETTYYSYVGGANKQGSAETSRFMFTG